MREPKFKIGDIVYHITPDSEPAAIVDIFYSYGGNSFSYVIAKGWSNEFVCKERELTDSKRF